MIYGMCSEEKMQSCVKVIIILFTIGLVVPSAESYSAIPYVQLAPIFPHSETILGLGINIPINSYLGITANYGANTSQQLNKENYIDNHFNVGFYAQNKLNDFALICKATGGIYKIDYNYSYSGMYYGCEYDYYYKETSFGTWTSGGCSLGLGFICNTGLLSFALIPTGHLLFDVGSKKLNDVVWGKDWLAHPYNTTFIEIPLEIGINIE
jgi:hypothetical protein